MPERLAQLNELKERVMSLAEKITKELLQAGWTQERFHIARKKFEDVRSLPIASAGAAATEDLLVLISLAVRDLNVVGADSRTLAEEYQVSRQDLVDMLLDAINAKLPTSGPLPPAP